MQSTIEKNAGKRSIAKLFLNSLYGKFGASNDKFVKPIILMKFIDSLCIDIGFSRSLSCQGYDKYFNDF